MIDSLIKYCWCMQRLQKTHTKKSIVRGFSAPQALTELLAETPSLKTSTSTVTRQVFVFFSLCYMELNTNIKPPWRWPTVLHKLDEDEHKTSNKQFCSKLPQRKSTKSKQWLFFQGEGFTSLRQNCSFLMTGTDVTSNDK